MLTLSMIVLSIVLLSRPVMAADDNHAISTELGEAAAREGRKFVAGARKVAEPFIALGKTVIGGVSFVMLKGAHGIIYVPVAAQADIRKGAAAWRAIREAIHELAAINKDEILERARSEKTTRRPKSPGATVRTRPSRSRRNPARS